VGQGEGERFGGILILQRCGRLGVANSPRFSLGMGDLVAGVALLCLCDRRSCPFPGRLVVVRTLVGPMYWRRCCQRGVAPFSYLPRFPPFPRFPHFPNLPLFRRFPLFPRFPRFPNLPHFPSLPLFPRFPHFTNLPLFAGLPVFPPFPSFPGLPASIKGFGYH